MFLYNYKINCVIFDETLMKNLDMKTLDWASIVDAKILLIGENSTLQWKNEIIEHVMFLDYYFNNKPYDLGERSRYSEAKAIFDYLREMTADRCKPEMVYGTVLCKEYLERAPRGKHMLIREKEAKDGLQNIKNIIKDNKSIKFIFVMGLQTNYYLQKLGLYDCGEFTEQFLKGAEPRRVGLTPFEPFYQPVDAKPFREICFKAFDVKGLKNVKIIPILPIKSYPLTGSDIKNFEESYEKLKLSFKK